MNLEVYVISDLNNKILYIGQGQMGMRVKKHFTPSGAKRFNKHPTELKILNRIIVESRDEAIDLEEKLIEELKPEFDKAKRGNMLGCRHSDSTKEKIGFASKNRSDETRRKIGDKIRERNLGETRSDETRNKISQKLSGRVLSQETREKMALGQKKRWAKK